MSKHVAELLRKYGTVAVMMGGYSAEREISLKTGEAVLNALKTQGVDAFAFDPKDDGLQNFDGKKVDRVWNALHGRGGEDGQIQGFLQSKSIPYTGCGVMASALAMDKLRTKLVWKSLGLPVAEHQMVATGELDNKQAERILGELNSVMVKPIREGSSVGMAKAESIEQLQEAVLKAKNFDSEIMLEQWVDGDEYTVAILNDVALPSIHMTTPNEFYDYEAKYQTSTTEYHCPSDLSESEESELAEIATKAFAAIGAQGWSRVDFLRDRQTKAWYLLEINTIPGMTVTSLVPKAAKVAGISFEQLVLKILDTSFVERS